MLAPISSDRDFFSSLALEDFAQFPRAFALPHRLLQLRLLGAAFLFLAPNGRATGASYPSICVENTHFVKMFRNSAAVASLEE